MNPRIELPSPETIAAFCKLAKPKAETPSTIRAKRKHDDAAYSHSRYLIRKARNYALGLNASGQVRGKPRNSWPQLKGLDRKKYRTEWDKLNPHRAISRRKQVAKQNALV